MSKAMDVVTVKTKFQIVIPQNVRERVHVEIGDILEAGVENGKIVFTPKGLVNRHIAEGLEDVKKGRTHGPYGSAGEAMEAMEARAKRRAKNRSA
ncbi:MAG: AbrB/MazE/SpoVT family DNA-binding domain-containing protein [Acidobacteriota bacterium]|nr:AbrB/MazE/SpoVT family DNA-binding domain-containing protein [Acidobacteriota bacterium]